jgi:hypothetical protein
MKSHLLVASLALTGLAVGLGIDWFTIDGGGGTSSGGNYVVSGTIGQHDAGTMSGGSYTLDGGFWAMPEVINTPGAPPLSISRSGPNAMLSWPAPSPDWQLQSSNDLINWAPVAGSPVLNGSNNTMNVSLAQGRQYYRLYLP